MKPTLLLLALAASAPALYIAGCASSGYNQAGDTSNSLQKAARAIDKGDTQIDTVLLALSDLVNNPGPNLKPQFDKYDTAVGKLESLAKEVDHDTTKMRTEGAAYFQNWDAELAKIHNEDIRSRSAERRTAVNERFDKVRVSYVRAQNSFEPFLSDLKDIRTALKTDLTAGGVYAVRSTANKAKTDVNPLRDSLRLLSADFKELGVSLSTETAPAK